MILTSSSTSVSSAGGAFGRALLEGCGFLPGRRPGRAVGGMTPCLPRTVLRGLTEITHTHSEKKRNITIMKREHRIDKMSIFKGSEYDQNDLKMV